MQRVVWVKQDGNGKVQVCNRALSPDKMRALGCLLYTGDLDVSRLSIVDGVIIENTAPEVLASEIVSKQLVIAVFNDLIAATDLSDTTKLKALMSGIAYLTTERAHDDCFNLLDPLVEPTLVPLGLTVDDLRAAVAAKAAAQQI